MSYAQREAHSLSKYHVGQLLASALEVAVAVVLHVATVERTLRQPWHCPSEVTSWTIQLVIQSVRRLDRRSRGTMSLQFQHCHLQPAEISSCQALFVQKVQGSIRY